MSNRVFFWLDAAPTAFCIAYYLKKIHDADFFALVDVTNRQKSFFKNQKLVEFKKTWFYHDFMNQKIKSGANYLKSFEKKYNIDLWQLAKNDRIFIDYYNTFYKFSDQEISEIMEKECKLFEEILDEIKPDFFITTETAMRPHHLFYLLCKKKGIRVLMLNTANWGNHCYISENYHKLDNFNELFANRKALPITFNDIQNRLESKILSKKVSKFYQSHKNSKIKLMQAAFQLLILSDNSNEKTHYTYYGRKKLKVLFNEISSIIKRWYRKKYIDQNFLQEIPNDTKFIFLPLQQEPERSLLLGAPDYKNQVKTVEYVSKCMPKNLGFNVIEVEHDKRVNIKKNLNIRILAADNCDPTLCLKYFGCGIAEKSFGSTTIDTLCAIDNGDEVIVNTNDCPFSIAGDSALKIKNHYKKINFLLLGYSSATAYPQCFELSNEELEKSKKEIVQKFLSQGESYINLFKPDCYMPFAGRYVLGGKKSILDKDRAKIEQEDALKYFQNSSFIQQKLHKGIVLNQNTSFDITTGELDTKYVPINEAEKIQYIENELSKRKYDYEGDNIPGLNDFLELIPKCYERFESKIKQLRFSSNTKVLIELPENNILLINANGEGFTIIPLNELNKINEFLMIKTDYRLLLRLLRGPKFAHWNNAEIGSHLEFIRNPNIYERGLFYCLNFFHA